MARPFFCSRLVGSDWGRHPRPLHPRFNHKLAVLVGQADAQIKKVRHARLILVNPPPASPPAHPLSPHISPACQLLCDSNHHRHMPFAALGVREIPTPPSVLIPVHTGGSFSLCAPSKVRGRYLFLERKVALNAVLGGGRGDT